MAQTDSNCSRCGATLPVAGDLAGTCPRCLLGGGPELVYTRAATAPAGGADIDIGTVQAMFPHFEILELIGRGGMGVVYKARQPQLDRLVAVKLLVPEIASDPDFANRFQREARALAKLSHPNIVGVYDFGHQAGTFYIVMEFVDGASLRDVMELGTTTPAEALAIVPQICAGLQFAHERGVVHRDIKPENILLDAVGQVKIADFGLAKLLNSDDNEQGRTRDHLTRASQVMGTPHYMAPEQVNTPTEVDHRADIYSLGVVFYEMLTKELPVGRFPKPSERVELDVRLDRVVIKALEREPEKRYQHASEIQEDVEGVKQGKTIAGSPTDIPRLNWIENLSKDGLIGVCFFGQFVAVAWFVYLLLQGTLFRGDWVAAGYPLCFAGFTVVRAMAFDADQDSRIVLRAMCFCGCVCIAVLAMASGWDLSEMAILGLAAALAVSAHLLFDRWIWTGRHQIMVVVAPMLAAAVFIASSAGHFDPVKFARGFASGCLFVGSFSSILLAVPEFARSDLSPKITTGIVRALCIGVPGAVVYILECF